ncbi:MAG TPA: helix-turn-helix domain-containing protein [Solirubrobacteraceae bacterium]|nr:helix-turn-helix domain-containing protein [Solirubrobacteraceae bacterium]
MEQPPLDIALGALDHALRAVGDRWTLLVVAALLEGPARFGDLERALPGIAPNVLSARLRTLEARGLVVARAYQRRPPRFAYELADDAAELTGALRLLAGWGARHAHDAQAPRHEACGTSLEARFWCPHCEQPVDPGEAVDLHYA